MKGLRDLPNDGGGRTVTFMGRGDTTARMARLRVVDASPEHQGVRVCMHIVVWPRVLVLRGGVAARLIHLVFRDGQSEMKSRWWGCQGSAMPLAGPDCFLPNWAGGVDRRRRNADSLSLSTGIKQDRRKRMNSGGMQGHGAGAGLYREEVAVSEEDTVRKFESDVNADYPKNVVKRS